MTIEEINGTLTRAVTHSIEKHGKISKKKTVLECIIGEPTASWLAMLLYLYVTYHLLSRSFTLPDEIDMELNPSLSGF